MRRRDILFGSLAATLFGRAFPAKALTEPSYPTRLVRIVVPFTPGAINDLLARLLAESLGKRWGQSVIVENKPGGGTLIGTEQAAREAPDGHSLLLVALPFAAIPGLFPKARVIIPDDFTAVSLIGSTSNLLVVRPTLNVSSVEELIGLAKREPGRLSYASAGNGSSPHLAMELFKLHTGIDVVHVPYNGAAPATLAVISGEVDLMINNTPNVIKQVEGGQLRALASTTPGSSSIASTPTMAQAGVPDMEITSWYGLVAPRGLPPSIGEILAAETRAALSSPQAIELMGRLGVERAATTPEEFSAFLRSEVGRWSAVIKAANIRAG